MNIKLIIAVVALLGITSGLFFWQLGRTSESVESGPTPAVPADTINKKPETDGPISGRAAMAALIALNRNLECRITSEAPVAGQEDTAKTEGTVFISGGAIRGDFMLEGDSSTEQIVSSMIVKDDTMYVWSVIDGESWGMKSSLTISASTSGDQLETKEPVRLDDAVAYDCKPWVGVDRSVFVPPSSVLFRDFSTIIENGMEYGTTFEAGAVPGAGDACTACALIDDVTAQAACSEQFSCKPEAR